MVGEDVEGVVVSSEIGWENDIGPRVSMEELGRETTGMIASMRDEGRRETEDPAFPMEKSFTFISHESFRDIGDTKQAYVPSEKEIDDDLVRLRNVRGSLEGKFVDVEPSESDEENVGVLESLSNLEQLKLPSVEGTFECTEKKEPIYQIASEILKGVREAEEEISAVKDGRGEMLGNVVAVVVSAEVGGENDINVEQVEEVDVVGPRVSTEDSRPKVKFADVEPGELEGETTGMMESIRDECRSEAKNHVHSMEKTSPFTSCESNECEDENADLQQLKLPSEEETFVASAELQEFSELVSTSQDTSKDEKLVPIIEDIQAAGNNAMFVILGELEPVQDIGNVTDATREDKDLENIGPKGDEGEITSVDVCVRKLVVHVKKSGGNKATCIREETDLSPRGKTLIVMRPDTRGTATECGLGFLGQDNKVRDHPTQSTEYHPEGIDHNSVDIQDANLRDLEVLSLAGTSTSKPIEGLNNEDSIWKQINAMRAIVGYEAPQHASCVEELKALYVFTGVEPPTSFSEPSSVVDVTEKLQFFMAIVGVKM